MTAAAKSAEEILLAFAAAVRAAGVKVSTERSRSFVDAVSQLSIENRSDVFWAGRATLCAAPEDLDTYQRTFERWFTPVQAVAQAEKGAAATVQAAALNEDHEAPDGSERSEESLRAVASRRELLRHRDVATLDAAERALLHHLFDELPVTLPSRLSRRKLPGRTGKIDSVRTFREQLRHGGEPGPLKYRRTPRKPRRIAWLIDVSGSMSPYADSLLRLAHHVLQAAPHQVEVFTLGTRLTRVTAALRVPDADDALALAGSTVPDWSGGTRLGEVLRAFNERWGSARWPETPSLLLSVTDGNAVTRHCWAGRWSGCIR
ncbi:VWA domain-containing protein [Arthrobacter alpinus]|nr:VWA domain-containing protein [Arthrobacter alpinus]